MLEQSLLCVCTTVPDYELVCYHLPRCLALSQALYILLALIQIWYGVAQATHHYFTKLLRIASTIAAHHNISFCDVAYPQLALLRGHFPYNLGNEFNIANIDQVSPCITS